MELGVPTCDLCIFKKVLILLSESFFEVFPCLIRGRFIPPVLESQGVHPCLVNSVIGCLDYFLNCEGSRAVLSGLSCIFHALKVDITRAFNLYRFYQGLSASFGNIWPNLPIPLHEVIHEVFPVTAWNLMYLYFFSKLYVYSASAMTSFFREASKFLSRF